jgi:hypothetical protein
MLARHLGWLRLFMPRHLLRSIYVEGGHYTGNNANHSRTTNSSLHDSPCSSEKGGLATAPCSTVSNGDFKGKVHSPCTPGPPYLRRARSLTCRYLKSPAKPGRSALSREDPARPGSRCSKSCSKWLYNASYLSPRPGFRPGS